MTDTISREINTHPEDWAIQRVDSLFDIQQGKSVSKAHRVGYNQKPFLRTRNISWGQIDITELDHMHFTSVEETRLELQAGDLLLCEGGDVGRTAIWNDQIEGCYYQNHLHRLRAKTVNEVDSQFTLYWFWYAFEVATIYIGRSNVTTIPNLSQSKLSELPIPKPKIDEQHRIAFILSTVQVAIEQKRRLISLTRELKAALMHKLFTEGLRGEKQKETEIGLVPESWEVVQLASLLEETEQVNMRIEGQRQIKYIDVSSISREYLRVENTTEYELKDAPGRARKKARKGDVIFATVRPTLLRVAQIDEELDDQVCSTAFCVLRAKKDISDKYIYFVVQREQFIKQLAIIESGASYPAVTDRQVKNQKVPKPKLDEQSQIAGILDTLDKNVFQHAMKKEKLEELFRTLLHKLMTGQTRANDIDLLGIS
jgi:type I restriction enzyme S subunit